MEKKYILFIVLNKVSKTKQIIKALKGAGKERFTIMNTFGSHSLCCSKNQDQYEPIVAGTLKSSMTHIRREYNKTFFVVLQEKEVDHVMDAVSKVLHMDPKKPGLGIMFTVPVLMSEGVRQ